jgi:triacylglycerol lipase
VQLMPEAMDLFIAGVEDRPGVLYQSTVSMAPPPSPRSFVRSFGGAWSVVSGVIFDVLYGITSRYDRRYPCGDPDGDPACERVLRAAFGDLPTFRANDGVVPIRSQIWGTLVWAGYADHLDVLGHFGEERSATATEVAGGRPLHIDWMCSGSGFDARRFGAMVDAIASGLLSSAHSAPGGA